MGIPPRLLAEPVLAGRIEDLGPGVLSRSRTLVADDEDERADLRDPLALLLEGDLVAARLAAVLGRIGGGWRRQRGGGDGEDQRDMASVLGAGGIPLHGVLQACLDATLRLPARRCKWPRAETAGQDANSASSFAKAPFQPDSAPAACTCGPSLRLMRVFSPWSWSSIRVIVGSCMPASGIGSLFRTSSRGGSTSTIS